MKISPAHLISSTFKINYSHTGSGIYQMYLHATQDPRSLYPKRGQEMGFWVGSQETCPPDFGITREDSAIICHLWNLASRGIPVLCSSWH